MCNTSRRGMTENFSEPNFLHSLTQHKQTTIYTTSKSYQDKATSKSYQDKATSKSYQDKATSKSYQDKART